MSGNGHRRGVCFFQVNPNLGCLKDVATTPLHSALVCMDTIGQMGDEKNDGRFKSWIVHFPCLQPGQR